MVSALTKFLSLWEGKEYYYFRKAFLIGLLIAGLSGLIFLKSNDDREPLYVRHRLEQRYYLIVIY